MKDVLLNQSDMKRCNMYSIGICDDGENTCAFLDKIILQYAKEKDIPIDINVWYSGEGLKAYLDQGNHLDILFLDIELFGMTGIDVGKYIRNELDNAGIEIVYISGKESYAQQLFKTQPLEFLVKPISQRQMDDTLDMAFRIIEKKKKRFEFQQGKNHYYIPMGNIMYLRSDGRKISIVTSKETFGFYGKLKEVIKNLSEDFIVIHQSYVVNKEYIYRYTYEMIELMDGTLLTISPVNRKTVRNRILKEEK